MKMRHSLLVLALAAFASAASAHDPSEFEGFNNTSPTADAAPTNCDELDRIPMAERDATDPAIKVLQEDCSAADGVDGSQAKPIEDAAQ